jgi:anti-sigma regulatory factor (Ser/Thr protein kinase)
LPEATSPDSHGKTVGRGIILMRTIMDEVRFNDAGNEVTLIKRPPLGQDEMPPADD